MKFHKFQVLYLRNFHKKLWNEQKIELCCACLLYKEVPLSTEVPLSLGISEARVSGKYKKAIPRSAATNRVCWTALAYHKLTTALTPSEMYYNYREAGLNYVVDILTLEHHIRFQDHKLYENTKKSRNSCISSLGTFCKSWSDKRRTPLELLL